MGIERGAKYGREQVRAISDPHQGKVLTGQIIADGDNQYHNLSTDPQMVEGLTVCMLEANAGPVYVVEGGKAWQQGARLWSGRPAVNLTIDDLARVTMFIPANGDGVDYVAIAQGGE